MGYALVRPFSYLRPTELLRPKLYFDLNLTSTFLSQLYFDFFVTTLLRLFCHNFTSTYLSQLYFDFFVTTLLRLFLSQLYFDFFYHNFTSTETLLRPVWPNFTSTFLAKLYFDQNFSSTKTVLRHVLQIKNPDLTKGRSTRVEVKRTK